jgi:hypothetical protein
VTSRCVPGDRAPRRRLEALTWWIRQGWSEAGWNFVALLGAVVIFTAIAWVGAIIAIINHPPPVWVWVIAAVFVAIQIFRSRVSSTAEPDIECPLYSEHHDVVSPLAAQD